MGINKNNLSKYFMAAFFIFIGKILFAQQQPQYTQYMYNTMSINPGYAGTNERLEASLLHRSQWVGVDGSPNTQSFTIDGKVGEKIGLGLYAVNDKIGPSNQVDINGAFAYHLITGYRTHLALGINAGFNILNIDWSKGRYSDSQDPLLNDNINKVQPIMGAGAFFYGDNWYVGASIPNFLKSALYDDEDEVVMDRENHYYLIGGYVFDLSEQIRFKPAVLTKIVEGAPITFDVSANFLLQEKFTFGAAYRFNDAISALVGLQISKSFFAGYAFDYAVTGLNKYNDGSHEIILRYSLPNLKQKARSPRFF